MENQEVSSNTQAPPEVAAPPSAGTNADDLAARVAELERQSEGRLRDLQEERRKRQELEQRIQPVPASPAVQNPGVEQDEVAKLLSPYIAPIQRQAQEALKMQQEMAARAQEEQALTYLSEKTGKNKAQLLADVAFQEKLSKVAQKWGFVTGSIDERTRKAYEAMELEDFRAQQSEKVRAAQAASQASLPAGNPPASVSSGKEYSASEFNGMAPSEFAQMERKGSFRKVGDKFVYTPH